jgi:N-ethylmaleimide reductase
MRREISVINIWTPTKIGNLKIKNRLVMAPMTRSRANPDGTPSPLAADYYAQRAGLGLLIASRLVHEMPP